MSPFYFILFAFRIAVSSGENILILHPIYCGSHEFVLRSLGDHLVQRGHQVTQVRFKQKNSHMELKTNVSVLTLNISDHLNNCGRYVNDEGVLDISTVGAKILWDQGHSVFGLPLDIFCLTDVHCYTLRHHPQLQQLLETQPFDLVIIDLIGNECSIALAKSFQAPIIGFWGFPFHGGEAAYTSVFHPPSLYPTFFSGLQMKMNFGERFGNFLLHLFHRLYMDFQVTYANFYVNQYYPQIPPLSQIVHDLDLILVNTNQFVDYPRLLPPNIKQVGGLQLIPDENVSSTQGRLPKDYQDFVSGAEDGVILFSLGYTGFSAKDVPQSVVLALLEAFSSMKKNRFVMRFDPEVMPFTPDNVKVSKWIPQQALLAHSNVVAFISHCGIGSLLEAVYHSVPIVGVGIFADQVDNAALVEDLGYGLRLFKHQLVDSGAIKEIVEKVAKKNSTYARQVSQFNQMWRLQMQIQSPKDEATFWIETLARYGHLDHLKVQDFHLNWIQYFSIDVVLVLFFLLSALNIGLIWICKVHLCKAKAKKD